METFALNQGQIDRQAPTRAGCEAGRLTLEALGLCSLEDASPWASMKSPPLKSNEASDNP